MAHKTFISYKYSEARTLRDRIIDALGPDATYYKGETSDSPDLTDTSTENIKKNLKDMMFDTSVTIVIISPHMRESKWIPWEIKYCLKQTERKVQKEMAEKYNSFHTYPSLNLTSNKKTFQAFGMMMNKAK